MRGSSRLCALSNQHGAHEAKAQKTPSRSRRDELRKEYRFDYSKSKLNRFAAKLKGTTAVVLQPDVAEVFQSADIVNDLLRSAIAATGAAPKKRKSAVASSGRAKKGRAA